MADMEIFERLESQVRSYSRAFPAVFARARGATLWDEHERPYLDFFAGAGALNYGHNEPRLKRRLIDYLEADGVLHTLDMATSAKREFLERFERVVLRPRGLDYRVQFTGPTGTNAVEAALKLARKVTGRPDVVHFHNAYHGMTLGALAVTGNAGKRAGAGIPLAHTLAMPFDGDLGPGVDTLGYLERVLSNPSSGVARPAAVIVETVQAEGGVRVASCDWLRGLRALTRRHGALLIVDEVQTGCGRTGTFFSFEPAGIEPDLVLLSKSIGGCGLPLALVLVRPDLDVWQPGEHNGTFRGQNLSFIAGAEALAYWEDDTFAASVRAKGEHLRARLEALAASRPRACAGVRGRGLMQGLVLARPGLGAATAAAAFERGLLIEAVGPEDEVLKFLPPLVVSTDEIDAALALVAAGLDAASERLAAPAAAREA
jgi:diaminobutyrate-2-oxoglutarate transaminase